MAYIHPESVISFCSLDKPITSDYQNTILFNSEADQLNYFESKVVKRLDNYSVIKKEDGYLRVSGSYAEWLDINYCFFTNPNFSNKVFYAFVDHPEYVAPNTTRIRFTIDVIQTYFLFSCNFNDCLIERETVAQDTLENCLLDEGLELGEYEIVQETYGNFDADVGDRLIVAAFTPTQELKQQLETGTLALESPGYYGGQFVPFYWGVWTETSQEALENLITAIEGAGQAESIIGMWYFYQNLIPQKAENGVGTPIVLETDIEKPLNWNSGAKNSLNGFNPKNNKLYMYPYTYLQLNGFGQIQDLKYEYTSDKMRLYAPFTPGSQMFMWPKSYNGLYNNYDAGVASKSLPLYGYSINAAYNGYMTTQQERTANLKNQQIQQGFDYIDSAFGSSRNAYSKFGVGVASGESIFGSKFSSAPYSAASILGGLQAGGILYDVAKVSMTSDYAKTKRSLEGQLNDALRRPTEAHNQNSIPELNYVLGEKTPFFIGKTQKRSILEIIDNYFSMYGYKVNRLGKPNLKSRKNWNYIKCGCANVSGNINEDDLTDIINILENGITFWHTTDVGNYDLDNSIV